MRGKMVLVTGLCLFLLSFYSSAQSSEREYQPTHDSVATHAIPEWYQDAKFGVIIHYGLYSVPGWAPIYNPVGKVFSKEFFINNPYAEWYANTMQIEGSPTQQYHAKTYGPHFKYEDFVPLFNQSLSKWNPDVWTELFKKGGVKYVVFTTKHHDGFLLWPSRFHNPYKLNYGVTRDVVGELAESVRKKGLHMGLYYSGGYDWSWPESGYDPITSVTRALEKVPQSSAYADYVFNQWNELIDRYHPDLLWNDIALPRKTKKWQLFANYYNQIPEGVFNNRWGQGDTVDFSVFGQPPDFLVDLQLKSDWFDYYSPEYIPKYLLTHHKWEADHGMGYSFGFNRQEYIDSKHLKTLDQLIEDLADLVSKNGNLLLGIGPEANGTIPLYQQQMLLGMGQWLSINGEAIYATKAWREAEGSANKGLIPIRYTLSKDENYLYLILLQNPKNQDVVVDKFNLPFKKIEVLNKPVPVQVKAQIVSGKLIVHLHNVANLPKEHALVLRVTREYVN